MRCAFVENRRQEDRAWCAQALRFHFLFWRPRAGSHSGKRRRRKTILSVTRFSKCVTVYTMLLCYPGVLITGPGGWPRTVGHDLKFESTGK